MNGLDGAVTLAHRSLIEEFIGILTTCPACRTRWLIARPPQGAVYYGVPHGRRYLVVGEPIACPECLASLEIDYHHKYTVSTEDGRALVLPSERDNYYSLPRLFGLLCAN